MATWWHFLESFSLWLSTKHVSKNKKEIINHLAFASKKWSLGSAIGVDLWARSLVAVVLVVVALGDEGDFAHILKDCWAFSLLHCFHALGGKPSINNQVIVVSGREETLQHGDKYFSKERRNKDKSRRTFLLTWRHCGAAAGWHSTFSTCARLERCQIFFFNLNSINSKTCVT